MNHWIILVTGVLALILAVWWMMQKPAASLNASGYTYPSSPGA